MNRECLRKFAFYVFFLFKFSSSPSSFISLDDDDILVVYNLFYISSKQAI